MSTTIRAIRTRKTLVEVKEAVDRLSKQNNSFLLSGPVHQDNLTLMMRQFAAMRADFRHPAPLSDTEHDQMVAQNFEEDVWRSFGLEGPLVPDELLKECQKRLLVAKEYPGSILEADELELGTALAILNVIHRKRKSSSSIGYQIYPKGDWASLKPITPSQFRKNVVSGFGKRFWALIIGNDAYPRFELKGCINDAILVREYLEEYLGVPSDHIHLIKNATRKEMTDGLHNLRDNGDIKRGDIILIHFSGHGTTYDPTEHFETFIAQAGSIEGICPVDRGPSVPDISDRELNGILNELHDEKGKDLKITLFLDCCRGGGAARSTFNEINDGNSGLIRYIDPLRTNDQTSGLEAMLNAADADPRRGPDRPSTSSEFWLPRHMDGFVQLAGCHDFQIAREGSFKTGLDPAKLKVSDMPSQIQERIGESDGQKRDPVRGPVKTNVQGAKPKPKLDSSGNTVPRKHYGCFTWALINVLRSSIGQTGTYERVVESIGRLSDTQDPVVVGRKNSRLWFRD